LLALAAYNTGEGNLRKAIRRNGGKPGEIDFWDLRLSGETRAHIPKLLALAAVISNSEQHGIALTPLPNQPALQTVDIGSQIDISQAAKLAKMDYAELRALNPGYLQWATHPDHPQQLLLPHANASALLNRLDELSDTTLMSWDRYEILAGDTLGGIARKLGISVDVLRSVNALQGSRIIAGDSLLIPRSSDADLSTLAPAIRNSRNLGLNIPAQYTIKRGDSLWSIARRYNLKSKEIATRNQIALTQILRPGQTLDLQYATQGDPDFSQALLTEAQATYLVRSGDSMARIAKQFNLDLQDLLRWNGISINQLIYPGQTIQFQPQDSEIN
jgi:membrane-bound lytic murein transglycosylase D